MALLRQWRPHSERNAYGVNINSLFSLFFHTHVQRAGTCRNLNLRMSLQEQLKTLRPLKNTYFTKGETCLSVELWNTNLTFSKRTEI